MGNVIGPALRYGFALLIAAFLVAPAFAVIPMAFSSGMFLEFPPPGFSTEWFREFLDSDDWMSALRRSLEVAAASTGMAVPLGVLAAYGLVRSRTRSERFTEPLLMLPMMVPTVISGFGLYLVALAIGLSGTLVLVAFAHAVIALPFVIVTVSAALRTLDFRIDLAARVHGATPAQAFGKVTVPLIGPAIVASALIALMVSLDETVVAMFLAGDTSPTLPVMMFTSITYQLNPLVPVAAAALVAVTGVLGMGAFVLSRLTRARINVQRDD